MKEDKSAHSSTFKTHPSLVIGVGHRAVRGGRRRAPSRTDLDATARLVPGVFVPDLLAWVAVGAVAELNDVVPRARSPRQIGGRDAAGPPRILIDGGLRAYATIGAAAAKRNEVLARLVGEVEILRELASETGPEHLLGSEVRDVGVRRVASSDVAADGDGLEGHGPAHTVDDVVEEVSHDGAAGDSRHASGVRVDRTDGGCSGAVQSGDAGPEDVRVKGTEHSVGEAVLSERLERLSRSRDAGLESARHRRDGSVEAVDLGIELWEAARAGAVRGDLGAVREEVEHGDGLGGIEDRALEGRTVLVKGRDAIRRGLGAIVARLALGPARELGDNGQRVGSSLDGIEHGLAQAACW